MSLYVKPIPMADDQLRQYINFGNSLYRGNACYVPPLMVDEIATLSPEKNPAYDFCRAQAFMAYRDGEPVGRIMGIVNDAVNTRKGAREARFGWVDFVDDPEVADALFRAVDDWARDLGMDTLVGPMGFTDMDHEGMLIEGFDEMGTMATIYNHPYYPEHMQRMGFEKEVDWVEYQMTVPDAIPEKYSRIADIVARKHNLHYVPTTSRKFLKEKYGHAIFDLINQAYDNLYGFSPLTERQIDLYINQYIGILRLDDVCLVADADDNLVAVGISMPSLSRALQKSGGKLLPTGWWHLLKAIKGKTDTVDLMLVGVRPDYLGKGVNAMLFSYLIPHYIANGYRVAESNPELEGNENVQKQWEFFERRQHRRRRAWRRPIAPAIQKTK